MKAKKLLFTIFILILIAGLAGASFGAYYFYNQYQTIKKNPEMIAQQEETLVLESLSGLMELPQDETPSIATILDIEKLSDQPFFKNANNGDKIVIYSQARKAILWRPATNKIIEVAPLVYDQTESEQGSSNTPSQTSTIEEETVTPKPTTSLPSVEENAEQESEGSL